MSKATVSTDACENVNLVLAGVFSENIEPGVAGLNMEIFLISDRQEKYKKIWLIKSKAHGDFERVTFHTETHTLQKLDEDKNQQVVLIQAWYRRGNRGRRLKKYGRP